MLAALRASSAVSTGTPTTPAAPPVGFLKRTRARLIFQDRVKAVIEERRQVTHTPVYAAALSDPRRLKGLSREERETCRQLYERVDGGLNTLPKLLDLLHQTGQDVHATELETELESIGFDFETTPYMDLHTFLRVMDIQKTKHLALISDPEWDTLEAFVALGGQMDKTGRVPTDVFSKAISGFGLDVDLQQLLRRNLPLFGGVLSVSSVPSSLTYPQFRDLFLAIRNHSRSSASDELDVDLEVPLEVELQRSFARGTSAYSKNVVERDDSTILAQQAARAQQLYRHLTQTEDPEIARERERERKKRVQNRFMAPTASSGVFSLSAQQQSARRRKSGESDTEDSTSPRERQEQDGNDGLGRTPTAAVLNRLLNKSEAAKPVKMSEQRMKLERIMVKHMNKVIANSAAQPGLSAADEDLQRTSTLFRSSTSSRKMRRRVSSMARLVINANGEIAQGGPPVKRAPTKPVSPACMRQHDERVQRIKELVKTRELAIMDQLATQTPSVEVDWLELNTSTGKPTVSSAPEKEFPMPSDKHLEAARAIVRKTHSAPTARYPNTFGASRPSSPTARPSSAAGKLPSVTARNDLYLRVFIDEHPEYQDVIVAPRTLDDLYKALADTLVLCDESGAIVQGAARVRHIYFATTSQRWLPLTDLSQLPVHSWVYARVLQYDPLPPDTQGSVEQDEDRNTSGVSTLPVVEPRTAVPPRDVEVPPLDPALFLL